MTKALVIVDVQNDFVNEALGTEEAEGIIEHVVREVNEGDYDVIFVTYDTHSEDYMNTLEGRYLPVPHCIRGTHGWQLNKEVEKALEDKNTVFVEKPTFGSFDLKDMIVEMDPDEVTLVGLCTDICVLSNALMIRAALYNTPVKVIEKACAGVTVEKHNAAIEVMKSCQIDII